MVTYHFYEGDRGTFLTQMPPSLCRCAQLSNSQRQIDPKRNGQRRRAVLEVAHIAVRHMSRLVLSPLPRQPAPLVRQGGLAFQRLAARTLKDDPPALNRPR